MAWRLANSLNTLLAQVDAQYPNRSKASDGTIGDSSHAASASDHNPNAQGVVTALDLTHDPAHGFDAHALAENLRVNRHPNLKYIISNGRITGTHNGWQWQRYNGSNPHSKHVHISVGVGGDGQSKQPYDDTTKWNIGGSMQGEIDLLNYKLKLEHDALLASNKELDLTRFKLNEETKALRAREKQAEILEKRIEELEKQVSGEFEEITEPVYRKK